MFRGKPTGSAMPLLWAHAEYIKLLRSAADGKVYDSISEVNQRYLTDRGKPQPMEVWKLDRRLRFMPKGSILRIHGKERVRLRWSNDNWQSQHDSESTVNALQIDFVDLPAAVSVGNNSKDVCIRFTFLWVQSDRWEGQDYEVNVR